jgi:cyclopropane fatty-acyl-phospholipid synthase-like methyltransferase
MKHNVDPGDWRDGDVREWILKKSHIRFTQKEHQFDLMIKCGLQPHHKLLDIGCGYLRGGYLFIPYLNVGNYYGIDKEPWLLKCGIGMIEYEGLWNKSPHISLVENFNIDHFNTKFDFMLAQSVFSHLSPGYIYQCITNVLPWLQDNGKFYATFFPGDDIQLGTDHKNRKNEYTKATQPISFYENHHSAKITYLGECGHPSGQHLLLIENRI